MTPYGRVLNSREEVTTGSRELQHMQISSTVIEVTNESSQECFSAGWGEELRAVELLAENGHGFQAATAACNLFEQSHFLTYVGMDDANARTFMQWTDPHRSPIKIRQLVDHSGKARLWPQSRCEEEYAKYRFLCGFKHNNPVFQRVVQLPGDPDRYMSQFALAESVWCVLTEDYHNRNR